MGVLVFGPAGAHRAAQRDAVEPGQHHVEHEQVECGRPRDVQGLATVPEVLDGEARQPQVELQQFTDGRIVLHDEHPSAIRLHHGCRMVPQPTEDAGGRTEDRTTQDGGSDDGA